MIPEANGPWIDFRLRTWANRNASTWLLRIRICSGSLHWVRTTESDGCECQRPGSDPCCCRPHPKGSWTDQPWNLFHRMSTKTRHWLWKSERKKNFNFQITKNTVASKFQTGLVFGRLPLVRIVVVRKLDDRPISERKKPKPNRD